MHDCYCFHHFCTVIIYIYSLYNYITHKVSARWGAPLRPANLSGRAISTVGGLDEEEEPNKTFCLPFVAKGEPLKTLSLHCLLAAVRSAHFSVAPFLGTIQFFPLTLQCAEHWIFSKWFSLALFPGFWLAPLWISSIFFLALQCAEHWFIVGLTLSSTRVSCLGRVLTSRFCGCLSTPVDNFPAWLHVSKNLDLDFHFHQFCDCEIFLWVGTTVTATKRRALQRQRSLARKQCFLHRSCLKIFHLTGLKRLVRILSGHHSRDPLLICRIKAAMASMVPPEKESWKCMRCRKVNKFSADYCPKCSRPWQEVIDRHFVDPRNAPPKSPRRQKAMPWVSKKSNFTHLSDFFYFTVIYCKFVGRQMKLVNTFTFHLNMWF